MVLGHPHICYQFNGNNTYVLFKKKKVGCINGFYTLRNQNIINVNIMMGTCIGKKESLL